MNSNIFSIEIFIDRIRLLEGERCYFPSTILKLLNYEPTLISTVENDVQSKLREYLNLIENSNEIRKTGQISELKDIDGNYVVRKGKSILFEANTLSLISEFNTLPLYILVCDDYFQPSHLVGVITIRLSELMTNLAKKISQINHTASEDIMGKFPIVNLMGDGIGIVTLKLRLLFIGANLAPHLPREQQIEIRTRTKAIAPVEKSVGIIDGLEMDNVEKSPEKMSVRNIGCQVDKKRNVRVQIAIEPMDQLRKEAQIGLTIDPNDPLLHNNQPPMMIYNKDYCDHYSSDAESQEEIPLKCAKNPKESSQKNSVKADKILPPNLPILNALLNELTSWKSQENLPKISSRKPTLRTRTAKPLPTTPINRSKSADNRPNNNRCCLQNNSFLERLSRPKFRPASPTGKVPRDRGWIRTEPAYFGPARSALHCKSTRTQEKRVELTNGHAMSVPPPPPPPPPLISDVVRPSQRNKSIIEARPIDQSDGTESPTNTPIPRQKRNPLVPPLFTSGTSISVPSFTGSSGGGKAAGNKGRPPLSPGKDSRQWNNSNNNDANSRSFSYDTNDTANEADHYLNLNPVQSNRSPHMSRSHAQPLPHGGADASSNDYDDNDGGDGGGDDGSRQQRQQQSDNDDSEYRSESNDDRANRLAGEYSDDQFNQSLSSENVLMARSHSRRNSNGSLVSQTSEWRTDYSFGSSTSQRNQPNIIESPSHSPDLRTHRSPPRSPVKQRRSLLSSGLMPGGRLVDGTASGSFRTFDSYKPSFNGSLEISNIDSSSVPNESMLRPGSVGADVTSFTKVTKYERSMAAGGHLNSNYGVGGMGFVHSTGGSLQTDDSQILTSESYY